MPLSQLAAAAAGLIITIAVSYSLRRLMRQSPKAIWPLAIVVCSVLAVAAVIAF